MIQKRIGKKVLGFGVTAAEATEAEIPASEAIRFTEPEDLLSFGMIPEFVGRLPVVTALDQLSEDELVMILTDTKNAMIKQFTKLLSMEGVNLNVTKGRPARPRRRGREKGHRRPRPAQHARAHHARHHV